MSAVTIFDIMTPGNVISYWDARKGVQNYMGEMLFPHTKQLGTELTKIGGREGIPVELKASAFDTQTTFRDRLSIETRTQTMPFFKEGMKIDEKIRQQLLNISAGGNSAIMKPLINNIFDDTTNLLKGARVVRERMAMELVATGKIVINSNGVALTYDYGVDDAHQKVNADTNWSDTENAKPLEEMSEWVDEFKILYGIDLGYALMTSKTFGYLKNNKGLIKQLYPTVTDPSGLMIRNDQVRQIVLETTGLQILINDNIYATQVKGANKKFFPDNVVSFLPTGGTLGNMVFGTTPEEIDLLNNALTSTKVQITDTGVAVKNKILDDPVNIETIVSQICLPSFSSDVEGGAGAILIANVVPTAV